MAKPDYGVVRERFKTGEIFKHSQAELEECLAAVSITIAQNDAAQAAAGEMAESIRAIMTSRGNSEARQTAKIALWLSFVVLLVQAGMLLIAFYKAP